MGFDTGSGGILREIKICFRTSAKMFTRETLKDIENMRVNILKPTGHVMH